MEVDQKVKVTKQDKCHLMPEMQPNLNGTVSPIEIFSLLTDVKELLELIVEQSNRYAHQNGRNFTSEILRQIWNEAVHKIKTNKMGFQILVSLFQ